MLQNANQTTQQGAPTPVVPTLGAPAPVVEAAPTVENVEDIPVVQTGPQSPIINVEEVKTVHETGSDIVGSEVVKTEGSDVQLLEYSAYDNVNQMLNAAALLIETGTLPNNLTEPEQVVGIMKYGDELGLSAMTALNNIHMIQGRPTLGVHVITAQLKRHGIEFQLIEDYVGVEMGGQTDARTTFRFIDHGLLAEYERKLEKLNTMSETAQTAYIPVLENLRQGIVKDVSYYWSQAVGSGLTTKPNWEKDPRNMMRVRCLSAGARMVKPEALLGFYETTELAEAMGAETEVPTSYTVETN